MANLIMRFSAFTEDENLTNLEMVKKMLKKPDFFHPKGQPIILTSGVASGKFNQTTSFDYEYIRNDITDLSESNKIWMLEWANSFEDLKRIKKDFGYKFHLNYELTIFNNDYPALYFEPAILQFLGESEIELSFYFYND